MTATPAAQFVRQVRYQNLLFWRSPVAAFFTIVLPIVWLVLFNILFGDTEVNGVRFAQFFTPAVAVFAAISASFTNLAINTAMQRDQGILKRIRGTPLPPALYMAGKIGSAVSIAIVSIVLTFLIGWLFYDFSIAWNRVHEALLVFVVGIGTFAALGLAVASLIKNGDAVPAVTNAIILPMAFISDVFIPTENAPDWVQTLGDVLPMKHFVKLFSDAFSPFVDGSVLEWGKLGLVAGWGIAGAIITIRYFSWEPRA